MLHTISLAKITLCPVMLVFIWSANTDFPALIDALILFTLISDEFENMGTLQRLHDYRIL